MSNGYMPFEYVGNDGMQVSEEAFFAEHKDIVITPTQKDRLKQNLEVQCVLVLKEFANKGCIVLRGFCKTFIFRDAKTKELYLKPLEADIGVFFRLEKPVLLIYDMRYVS